jgi:sulfate adenylyltransferase (ADP) / ATP adenylyltransferase
MPDSFSRFQPGTLWYKIVERTQSALASGALHPIATENRTIDDHGVRFEIRIVSNLGRKIADGQGRWPTAPRAAETGNPFLPYEEELFVADVSDTHLCLLNKYNVLDHHVLIVTRAFEPQESLLTRADFEALWSCMAEYDALGFYNSGPIAGASQPHKHLQLAPLPLSAGPLEIPVAALFDSTAPSNRPTSVARLPFRQAFAWIDSTPTASPTARAAQMHDLYHWMLSTVGPDAAEPQPPRYNLLVTRRFMLLIPRRRERFESVSINALGFAGSFFVAEEQSLDVIVRIGPMELLKGVTYRDSAPD